MYQIFPLIKHFGIYFKYELKGDAKLPVKNVTIKNVKVGEVKKFVKKVNNVENVVEKNVTYEREVK